MKFSVGPTGDGQFGSTVTGKGEYVLTTAYQKLGQFKTLESPYIGFDLDGIWQTGASQPSNASFELQGGVDTGLFSGQYKPQTKMTCDQWSSDHKYCVSSHTLEQYEDFLLSGGMNVDLKERYGTITSNGSLQKVDQFLTGGSVYFVITSNWKLGDVVADEVWPRIAETYYHPVENSGGASLQLPTGVTANYLQSELSMSLGFGKANNAAGAPPSYPVSFDVTYDGSQPMTGTDRAWESLWKLQLSTTLLKKWTGSVQPSITYTSGKNGGFDYDKQVMFGILLKLLDPKDTSSSSK